MKIFQILYNNHPLYLECISRNKDVLSNHEYELISERKFTNGSRSFQEDTDIERVMLLAENPDSMYLDSDLIINSIPDFKPNIPYVSKQNDVWDTWAIYPNGCKWFTDLFVAEFEKHNGNPPKLWSHKIIESIADRILPMPEGCFNHLYLSPVNRLKDGQTTISMRYRASLKNGQWELKIR